MGIWSEIRREVLTGALSKRAAIAKYGIGWHTLKKMLAHGQPSPIRGDRSNCVTSEITAIFAPCSPK